MLYLRFPKNLRPVARTDLIVRPSDANPHADPSRILATVGDTWVTGCSDDAAGNLTAFVSGCITAAAPRRGGSGAAAASVLAELYARHGTEAFALIDGAFIFAIIDWRRGTVLVGRDKLGLARAYLSRTSAQIEFSDRMSELRRAATKPYEIDLDSVYAFLVIGWVPTPHSLFRGVEKLSPGTFLESDGRSLNEVTYYDVPHTLDSMRSRPSDVLIRELSDQLDGAVSSGLALGGRWGSFLSGGVDSSSVVSAMASSIGSSFPTYFGGFAPDLNRYLPNPEEPALSNLVADRFGTNHHMLWLGTEALESVPAIIGILEEPVCDGGCVVLNAIMDTSQTEVDSLMTGIGGDFLFTGERRHMVLALLNYMRFVPDPACQALRWFSGRSAFTRTVRGAQVHFDISRLISVRRLTPPSMYAGFFRQIEAPELAELLLPEVAAQLSRSPIDGINGYFQRSESLDPLSQFLYLDLKTHTPDHCAREAETLARHSGLGIHHPFLVSPFVDFAMTIPASEKVSGLTLKVPLKRAMRGRVPDEVLDRKKGGLGSPIRWWITRPDGLVASTLSRASLLRRGLFSPDAVDRFRNATAEGKADYTKLLWSLFTFELWMQQFVDS